MATDAEIEAELVCRATSDERVAMDDEDFREIREAAPHASLKGAYMAIISINVSDGTMPQVKAHAAALGHTDPADYLLQLLQEDLQYAPKEDEVNASPEDQRQLESILIERIESKNFVDMKEGEFERLGEEVMARLGRSNQS